MPRLVVAVLLACTPLSCAFAQTGAQLSVATDDIFRGHSLSEGRPVARGELSYDAASGVYAGVAIAAVATRDTGLQFLVVQENIGYAHAIKPGVSIELGVIGYTYGKSYSGLRETTYFEPYLGLATQHFAVHLHFAPDYLSLGQATLYGDVEGSRAIAPHLHINLHVGVLAPIGHILPYGLVRSQYDWRAGISIDRGAFALQLSLAGLGPNADYYAEEYRGHSTVFIQLSRIF